MSINVLVIPEDPTYDGYILKPLVEAMLKAIGKPNARVTVLTNPHLKGFDDALKAIRTDLPDRYGFWDLWLFFPDADRATTAAMEALEHDLAEKGIRLFCCPAQPEVEIYACAPWRKEIGNAWNEVRTHPKMKEKIFEPLLAEHGDSLRPGGGRDLFITKALANLPALYQLCPELDNLRARLADALNPQ